MRGQAKYTAGLLHEHQSTKSLINIKERKQDNCKLKKAIVSLFFRRIIMLQQDDGKTLKQLGLAIGAMVVFTIVLIITVNVLT